jgi:hypothetical protein
VKEREQFLPTEGRKEIICTTEKLCPGIQCKVYSMPLSEKNFWYPRRKI